MPPRISPHIARRSPHANLCPSAPKARHFTTPTTPASIPPESPKFISVPQSRQPDAPYQPYIKGILPVPRQIFPHTSLPNASKKASSTYLASVTPEPRRPREPSNPLTAWKTQQAAARRRNLREGLLELHKRKQKSDAIRTARSWKLQREHEQLVAMPMREDERLTAPTILSSQLPSSNRALDPDRDARVAAMKANVAAKEAERKERRREDLHALYMNAGTFTTNEAQLNAVVDKVFDDKDQFRSDMGYGENIWHTGEPPTMAKRLQEAEAGGRNQDSRGKARLVKERMKKIAEVLTGGKMQD